ncbi:MAG TPA: aminotransferase class I/II-fold pyridoxal phosphate-dependent enzyme [Anaerolineaceae bacterium]
MDPKKRSKLSVGSKMVYYPVEPRSKSVSEPIYMASNFEYDTEIYQRVLDGERKDVNIYSRCGNPSEYKFEDQMIVIENAEACLATASGMAAIAILMFGMLKGGDHIVSDWTTYSTTHEFLDHRFTDFGVQTTFVDTADINQVAAAIRPNTRMIYCEAIANPTMKVSDIAAIVELAHSKGIAVVCDNTFASPYVFRPHDLGVDFVVESATKWIGGHNDALGGTITMKTKLFPADYMETIRWSTLTKLGGALSPFNAWLLLRGIQTLHVRMDRSCATAMKLAHYLEGHPKVRKVWYPGLESHPQHEIAKRQMPLFGGMLCFEVKDEPAAVCVLDALELATFGASLGGVRTTTQAPSTMAFLDVPPEEKARMNIRDGMARVSVGLEDADDLIADFEQALEKI